MRNITLAILLILGLTMVANAGIITDRLPDDDTMVYQRSATRIYDPSSMSFTDWDGYVSGGDNETAHTMMEFDITDVDATVNSATLNVWATAGLGSDAHAALGTSVNLPEDWDETTVSWSSCSGGSINTGVVSASDTLASGYGNIFDVTSIIQAAVTAGQDKVTIYLVMDPDMVKGAVYNKEISTRAPLLGVDSIPEPATMGLLLLGGLGVLARKRR